MTNAIIENIPYVVCDSEHAFVDFTDHVFRKGSIPDNLKSFGVSLNSQPVFLEGSIPESLEYLVAGRLSEYSIIPATLKAIFVTSTKNLNIVPKNVRVYVHVSNFSELPGDKPHWVWARNSQWLSFFDGRKVEEIQMGDRTYLTTYLSGKGYEKIKKDSVEQIQTYANETRQASDKSDNKKRIEELDAQLKALENAESSIKDEFIKKALFEVKSGIVTEIAILCAQ